MVSKRLRGHVRFEVKQGVLGSKWVAHCAAPSSSKVWFEVMRLVGARRMF